MKRKIISLFLFLTGALFAFGAVGCMDTNASSSAGNGSSTSEGSKETPMASVEKTGENLVVIKVFDVEGEKMLVDVMSYLQTEGELSYTISGGMISAVNGKTNPADYSSCWMLYTSDAELSNSAWGTVTVDGRTFGSAICGAEALPVVEGEVYVWSYQTF